MVTKLQNDLLVMALLVGVLQVACSNRVPRIVADTVLVNGKIITVSPDFRIAEAVAVKDSKFIKVGKNDEVRALVGDSTKVVDLGGKSAIPGMIDNHVHAELAALCTGLDAPELDILRTDSIQGILQQLKQRIEKTPPGEWVITTCMYRGKLKEGRLPMRQDLDPISPQNPVFLRRTGGSYVLNSAALKLLKIDEQTPFPKVEGAGGEAHRDPATGRLTGYFTGSALAKVQKMLFDLQGGNIDEYWELKPYSVEQTYKGLKEVQKLYNQCGLTGIRELGASREDFVAYQELWKNRELTVRVNVSWGVMGHILSKEELVRTIANHWGPETEFGDEWLNIGGIKIHNFGRENVRAAILEANRRGWQLLIHFAGGVGEDYIVDLLEEADKEKPIAGRRFTLEHDFLAKDKAFYDRIKRLGIILAPQPKRIHFGERDTSELPEGKMPLRDWIEAGLVVTGGTDHPGTYYDPDHPLMGIYAAVTRKSIYGGVHRPDQKLARADALKLFTINGAYATFEEKIKGSIEEGKLADLVVLSDHYLDVPDDKLIDIKVLATVVGGKFVYDAIGLGR